MKKILGLVPQKISEAETFMQGAESRLAENDLNKAIQQQMEVLKQLRAGLEHTTKEVVKRLKKGVGRSNGVRIGQQGYENADPFGRTEGGFMSESKQGGSVVIPSTRTIHRNREIFNELKRRIGDLTRPKLELEFLDRLLRRF